MAVDAARALMPLLEPVHGEHLAPVREALSRLQMAYAQQASGGAPPAAGATPPAGAEQAPDEEGPGPAQSSGRLWVPGQ
jgi:hypothetical protein